MATSERTITLSKPLCDVPSDGTSLRIVPPGFYLMHIAKVDPFEKEGVVGQVLVRMTFRGIGANTEAEKDGIIGEDFVDFLPTAENALFRMRNFADAVLGHPVEDADFDCDKYEDRAVVVEIEDNTWEGKTSSRVSARGYHKVAEWEMYAPLDGDDGGEIDLESGFGGPSGDDDDDDFPPAVTDKKPAPKDAPADSPESEFPGDDDDLGLDLDDDDDSLVGMSEEEEEEEEEDDDAAAEEAAAELALAEAQKKAAIVKKKRIAAKKKAARAGK